MGTNSAPVPVKKHSSALNRSWRVRFGSPTLKPGWAAGAMTTLRGVPKQRAGRERWGQQATLLDDKDIVTGAFSHEPLRVQHNRFLAARVVRFDLRQDVVQVVERLNRRVERAVQ